MVTTPIPGGLSDTLNSMQFRRRAGEWELQPADPEQPSTKLVTDLLGCLPWASLESLKVSTPAGVTDVPPLSLGSEQDPDEDLGFAAEVSLDLHWVGPDGELGRSRVPGAGRLMYDRDANIVTLTIWPNFFTDSIRVRDCDGIGSTFVDWPRAAELNRRQVADSLRCWTEEHAGSVLSAESELLEGIGTEGFLASAEPR